MSSQIKAAQIIWQQDQQGHLIPTSCEFDDVYFSKAGGLEESCYVFLQGNDLPSRFANLGEHGSFVIAETGFGTGLNFLATCQLWKKTAPKTARLHFISTEKYPLSPADMAKALKVWQNQELTGWIQALLDNYPLAMNGCHRLHISQQITLDLWFGDAKESFECLLATKKSSNSPSQAVDAWFLDGFSPNKNSDLWSEALFSVMAQLSHQDSSLATFTAAGFVRRNLLAAGFLAKKIKGFGKKREMLIAGMNSSVSQHTPKPKHIAIIGAGISGVMAAHQLARRGHTITIVDKNPPMSGASGNPRALFSPKLTLIEQAKNHLPTVSFLYSQRKYKELTKHYNAAIFEATGVIDCLLPSQKTAQKRQAQITPYPDELIQPKDLPLLNADFSAYLPTAGLVCPSLIAQHLLSCEKIHFQTMQVNCIKNQGDQVQIVANDGDFLADLVIISAGFQSDQLDENLFVCRKIRGQLSWVKISDCQENIYNVLPDTPIKYDGYCASFQDLDGQASFLFGASFIRNQTNTDLANQEHEFNLNKLAHALPTVAQTLPDMDYFYGKVGIRAQTPDYHPLVGQIQDKSSHYTLYGMGSKGFSFAPFCAEILADLIDGTILPIDQNLLEKLNPSRPRLKIPLKD